MEEDLGAVEFEKLIYFIRNINVKEKAKEDILKEFNKQLFGKGIFVKGIEFIDYIAEYKEIYQQLILDNNIKLDAHEVAFKNLLHIMVTFFPSNEWMPVLLFYYKKFRTKDIYKFLVKLEQKVVAEWVIALTPTKRTVNINNILRKISVSNNPKEVINSESLDYDKNAYIQELSGDVYGKRHDKYILMKLEYLESEKNVLKQYSTISVEHVLPQNPKTESQWREDFSEEERMLYTNQLCNLVLLSKKKNSSASNYDFEEKKKRYLQEKITDLARSQAVISEPVWTPQVLRKRQEHIIELLSQWN